MGASKNNENGMSCLGATWDFFEDILCLALQFSLANLRLLKEASSIHPSMDGVADPCLL